MSKPLMTDDERERVRKAVARAEARTAGEIVPYVVERCGTYEVALWRGAGAGLLAAQAKGLLVAWLYDGWSLGWLYTAWGIVLLGLLGALAGALAAHYIPVVTRFLAGGHLVRQVHARAVEAFVDEEVFQTRDRTGILLFVALFEHRIEVLGDAGINAKVQPEEWGEVVARIRAGIRAGRFADGLIEAIDLCGQLLERHVEIRPDDTDELSDDVRIRKD